MTARRTATIRLQLDTADAPLSADAARDVLGEAVDALADVAYVTDATLGTADPIHPAPLALIDTAARATVAAFPDAEDNGDGIPDLAWMLGGAVTYEAGLARFAAEVLRAAAAALLAGSEGS